MNRMWVRLSLAFTAVIIITTMTIGVVMRLALQTNPQFEESISLPLRQLFEEGRPVEHPIDLTTITFIVAVVAVIAGVGMSRSNDQALA
ncbi:MAG: hypothetical protein M5U34_16560 [Chloroflexi bacterium]|nr:hypothetical protein [Chloroflexota bacterium]